jgi:hypothetical protein
MGKFDSKWKSSPFIGVVLSILLSGTKFELVESRRFASAFD